VPALVLANQLLDRLIAALREHNAIHVHEASIRLRLVLHSGPVQRDETGVAGLELNVAFRLLDAPVAKQLLRESTASSPGGRIGRPPAEPPAPQIPYRDSDSI
jgi:class 3 adenylate cyclase